MTATTKRLPAQNPATTSTSPIASEENVSIARDVSKEASLSNLHIALSIVVLLINYFLAQYDKFILSYFQLPLSAELHLAPSQYSILSGYATGIVYAIAALPIAYLADYLPQARVWTLTVAALWWSLCTVFQSLARTFPELLLARIGMGLGQSVVEPIGVSLISDMFSMHRTVFIGESVLFVGVYIGEAISGRIATAFTDNDLGWRIALRAIGITGLVVAVLLRLIVRDHRRLPSAITTNAEDGRQRVELHNTCSAAKQLHDTFRYIMRMRSFWLLTLSASIRQLAGNVFGYYMPSYLSSTYPSHRSLLENYGIIVGVVGSVAVLTGGATTRLLWTRTKTTPLYLTAIGGMVSSVFVLLMLFSRRLAHNDEGRGLRILYGTMSIAYLTAELWLGALSGLIALILPPANKTFGLAIYSAIQVLIYSSSTLR